MASTDLWPARIAEACLSRIMPVEGDGNVVITRGLCGPPMFCVADPELSATKISFCSCIV